MGAASISCRVYRDGDLPAMAVLTEAVFAEASIDRRIEQRFGRPGAAWSELKADALRREVEGHPEGCFVAEADGEIVGYVTTTIQPACSRGVIANLAVAAAAQGHGLGRQLIGLALDHFRSLGLKHAKIETLATNEAGKHLYPKMGFEEIVRQVHYAMAL